MKRIGTLVAVGGMTLGGLTVSSSADTIVDIVAQSGGEFDSNRYDYDILLNAVLTVGLQGDLAPLADETANLTVFAPNDIGFIRLARDLGYAGTDATSRDGRRVKAAGLESGPALAATW